jgi:copper chaperone CopZ
MKKLLSIVAAPAVLGGMLAAAALAFAPATAFAGTTQTTVKVTGWHCAGCAEETADAVKKVKGVKSADADFDKGEVVVAYDDTKAKPADFAKAVKKSGYQVAK